MPNPLDDVTQDLRDDDGNPLRRVYVNGAGQLTDTGDVFQPAATNRLTQAVAPAQQYDLPTLIAQVKAYLTDPTGFSGGTKVGNRLFGTGGEERYQTWPEKMIRSGATLAGDEMAGGAGLANMGLRREDVTDIPKPGGLTVAAQPGDETRERVMDMAGLAGGGALTERPGAGTLGSGPLRPGAKAVPVEPAPVFYSALEHATTNAAQDVMSPQQWLGYLKNQPGVKAEELTWTGLPEWLAAQKGKVKKEDVKTYLDEHKVEIKDVTKGDDLEAAIKEHIDNYWAEEGREPTPAEREAKNREIAEDIRANPDEYELGADMDTKYSGYQLPGGENYREHLLTMPEKPFESTIKKSELDDWADQVYGKSYDQLTPTQQSRAKLEMNLSQSPSYKSSHWDEPNVLAHVRTNDRTMARTEPVDPAAWKARMEEFRNKYRAISAEYDNPAMVSRDPRVAALDKEYHVPENATVAQLEAWEKSGGTDSKPLKSLHIEEIQSDWHQQGRKQGYKGLDPVEKAELTELNVGHKAGTLNGDTAVRRGELLAKDNKGVPDAPFKTTWPELALKRMIRHAAENGYDRISWTPGEAQAARYDLSKTYEMVSSVKRPDGYAISVRPKDGRAQAIGSGPIPAEKLPDYVGKELADKIVNSNKDENHFEGLDLKVGGEGMREFYDKMLPKMAEKIGKAHGVKVKQINLPADRRVFEDKTNKEFPWHAEDDKGTGRAFKTEKEAREWAKQGPPVHYFDLPQSLKDHAIGKGFPLYMSGIPFPLTPVDHDPFKKEKK